MFLAHQKLLETGFYFGHVQCSNNKRNLWCTNQNTSMQNNNNNNDIIIIIIIIIIIQKNLC
jgi:hypothetical protein